MVKTIGVWGAVAGLALAAGGAAPGNGPERLNSALGGGADVVGGTMDAQVVNGCYALVTGTVTSADVGGSVSAWFNAWDDGAHLLAHEIPVPGNGATHAWCHVYQQLLPVGQIAPGIGLFLEDAAGSGATIRFATVDPLAIADVCSGPPPSCPASAVEIPAADRKSLLALALLLVAIAAWALMRRRRPD